MRLTILCAWLMAICPAARAVSPLDFQRALTSGIHQSLSGQFTIHDAPPVAGYLVDTFLLTNFVRVDPSLLAVSCERIKTAVLEQLAAKDQWRDRVTINLHHTQGLDDHITIVPLRFDRDWLYRVDVPDFIDRYQLISGIAQVVLLELANRTTTQSAEIPQWLVQGIAREIQYSAHNELIIDPPKRTGPTDQTRYLFNSSRRTDPLTAAHEQLRTLPPLTLDQLSWPNDFQFTGPAASAYGCSAQLFFHDLLTLPNGRYAMRSFVQSLPQFLNWQIAFLRAFHADFATQRQLEKWWALDVVQFTGRDLTQTWSADESWNKLDQLLTQPVEVRSDAKAPPLRSQVTLATIIHDWDLPRQKQVLRDKSQQLFVLRLRVSQDLVYLVDDYRRVIDSYLAKKDFGIAVPLSKAQVLFPPSLDDTARIALNQLAVLETRRAQLRPKPAQSIAAVTR